ncbi:MAG: hypothetical protein IJB85_01135 [Clostridia bacterium]|nr:hypothetical protein [Clostridia bacterium]
MTIETNITNRRELAGALAQYMNTRAVYLGPPTFAYQIGDIHLSREGILSGDDLDGIFPFLEMQGIVAAQPKQIQEPVASTASGIWIPLEGYTPMNLRNLLSMLYGKQWLIRKACSMPALHIPESAVNSMPTDTLESAVQSILDLKAADAFTGIDITCEQITFSVDVDADLEAVQIFLQHVVQSAKAATRVFPAYHPQENEKYIMHGWMIRLGLMGPEHKSLRKSLMSSLHGNCAFRSATDAQAHRAKYARLRRELREAGETHGA